MTKFLSSLATVHEAAVSPAIPGIDEPIGRILQEAVGGIVAAAPALGLAAPSRDRSVDAERRAARDAAYRSAYAAAAADERVRVAGILNHEEARGREQMARKLAFETPMSVVEAAQFMAGLPNGEAMAPNRLDRFLADMSAQAQPGAGASIDRVGIYASRAAAVDAARLRRSAAAPARGQSGLLDVSQIFARRAAALNGRRS